MFTLIETIKLNETLKIVPQQKDRFVNICTALKKKVEDEELRNMVLNFLTLWFSNKYLTIKINIKIYNFLIIYIYMSFKIFASLIIIINNYPKIPNN